MSEALYPLKEQPAVEAPAKYHFINQKQCTQTGAKPKLFIRMRTKSIKAFVEKIFHFF